MANRRFSTRDVRTRTTILASAVVGIALLIAGATLLILLRDRLVGIEISSASLRTRDLAALAKDGDLPDNLSFPGDDEESFSQVVRSDGEILAATPNVKDEPLLSELWPSVGESRFEVRGNLPVDDHERFAISARTVKTDDGDVTVLAGSSLAAADKTWHSVLVFLLIGSPLLVLLVAVVTRRVVRRALAPVESIRRRVTEISDEGLDKRVPEPGTGDEIDRLASSMNSMLERLEQSSDRQRRFVADASHELRSPLASARTTLEVAAAHPSSSATLLAAISDALIDQHRLEALVNDLLTLARLDDGSRSHAPEQIDLGSTVARFVDDRDDNRVTYTGPGASGSPEAMVWCRAEPAHLQRILTNLVDNAVTYCATRVEVGVVVDDGMAVIWVDDDGPGIPPDQRERVFERFVRLDHARTAERGTGLGLAIVRDLLRAGGGVIFVTDSAMGGARLVAQLPGVNSLGAH